MNEEPIEKITAHLGHAARTVTAAVVQYASVKAHHDERRARQRTVELREQERRAKAAAEVARLANGPDEQARKWLDAVTASGSERLARDMWTSPAWPALAQELKSHEAEGRDVVVAIHEVVPQRDFDDRRDSAAILHWRVTKHFEVDRTPVAEKRDDIGDRWQWAEDDAFVVRPKAKGPGTSTRQAEQFRPRNFDPTRRTEQGR